MSSYRGVANRSTDPVNSVIVLGYAMSFHFLAAIQSRFTCTHADVRHRENLPTAVR
jgi:hypothetical protein